MSHTYDHDLEEMIASQIVSRGVRDKRVLEALRQVPRYLFVSEGLRSEVYEDYPVPIGYAQTISQPYIVALMTEHLDVQAEHRVLEIGTGSGYQAAILSVLAKRVVTMERIEPLYRHAKERLLPYPNVLPLLGDGYLGYQAEAPYDRIILTAAPPKMPSSLLEQLAVGGRLVAPVGVGYQRLECWVRVTEADWEKQNICDVIFVPMKHSVERGNKG